MAWYVVPALFAKIFGEQLLTFFMYVWTATGIFIVLSLSFSYLKKLRHLLVAALVFFFFSGLDAAVLIFYPGYGEPLSTHWLQWWTAWGHIGSNLFNIVWIPQHLIGASGGAALFLYNRRLALQHGTVIVAIVSLWSPFCALGLLPIIIRALIIEGYRTAFTVQNLLSAPLILIPIFMYAIQGSEGVPFMFGWEFHMFSFSSFVLFCAIEFLLVLAILYYMLPKEKRFILILGVFLTMLSLIIRDVTFNNLLMRGSMPAICIIAALVVKSLLENEGWRRELLILYLLIGALPVAAAFAYGFHPFMRGIDKKMTFEKMTTIYPYEKFPNMTDFYLVKTEHVQKFFNVPLMRGLPEASKDGR